VPPFIGHPQGFSTASLELLDQGLSEIWHQLEIEAEARNKRDEPTLLGSPASMEGAHRSTLRQQSPAPAIVK
jgi:hypothetical protein